MRTIKFRGYNKKRGIWLYGNYILNRGAHFIAPQEFANGKTWEDYEVEEESIGQFTGLTDKNGKEIYEGDIISSKKRPQSKHLIFYCEKQGKFMAGLYGKTNIYDFGVCGVDFPAWMAGKEVIGNIHDNPELLEEGGAQ